jgi:hypothetical protein
MTLGLGLGFSSGKGSVPAGGVQPLSAWYEPEAKTYFAAVEALGVTLSKARKYTVNRAIYRAKRDGYWSALIGWWIPAPTEAAWMIDVTGQHNLVKQGNPTFAADSGVSTSSTADYYDTTIAFNSVPQNDHNMGVFCVLGSASSANSDMGVLDGLGNFLSINTKITSTNTLNGGSFGPRSDVGSASFYAGTGADMINRTSAASFNGAHNGIVHGSVTSASVAVTSTNTITILKINGSVSASSRKIASAWVAHGLTVNQMAAFAANVRNLADSMTWGEPEIQPVGYGDAVTLCDVPVYAATLAGFIAAAQLVRQGRATCIIAGPTEKTVSAFGGMPAGGLGWLDTKTNAVVSGLFRTVITWSNLKDGGRSNTQTIVDMSITGRWYNRACRWMADPTKSDPNLPSGAIPILLSDGIASIDTGVNGIGREFTKITLRDGKVIRPNGARGILINCDYEGDPTRLLGIPYTLGTEAQGTAPGENLNGFQPSQRSLLSDGNGNTYPISPYVDNVGLPLLPDLTTMPAITSGQPDPSLESMNYRVCTTNLPSRQAPLWGGAGDQPDGYDPSRYEIVGRLFDAMTQAGRAITIDDIVGSQPLNSGGANFDWNSGPVSTDVPQSGIRWLQALADYAARDAVIMDVLHFDTGFFYWILNSGDPRITPAAKAAISGYGLDTTIFLDPPDGYPLFWPQQLYRRDPIYQMKNTFNWNGHDTFDTTGAPRSIKTVSVSSYRADRHAVRRIAYDEGSGTFIFRQAFTNDSSANVECPIPLEVIVPDKADCTNYISAVASAMTKISWYCARMECQFGLAAQSAAIIADHALLQNVAVQDIDYPTFRAAMLAVPDAVTPVLPQVN